MSAQRHAAYTAAVARLAATAADNLLDVDLELTVISCSPQFAPLWTGLTEERKRETLALLLEQALDPFKCTH
jgi:hypothetical protein